MEWCLLRQKSKHDAALQAVDALRGSTASSDPTATAADSSSSADPASSSSSSTAQEKSRSAAQARKIAELETQAQGEAFKLERIHTASTKLAALKADSSSGGSSSDTAPVLSIAGDFMADLLDQRLGSSVVEPSIYRAHAAKFEVSVNHQAEKSITGMTSTFTYMIKHLDGIGQTAFIADHIEHGHI